MSFSGSPLPDCVNPNNFPAKLWRMVNNPANRAIYWGSDGDVVIINRCLFERQVLSPRSSILSDSNDTFKTTNFSSFVRQLNLYGFRKSELKDIPDTTEDSSSSIYHFTNPNFKRDHPQLVASLRRLTVENKAKIQAGITVNCRPPSKYQRLSPGEELSTKSIKRGCCSLFSPTHQGSIQPYPLNKAQTVNAQHGTPIPPQYLIRGTGALCPTLISMNKGLSVSLNHSFAGGDTGSSPMHIQQGVMTHANHATPHFAAFSPSNAPCHSPFMSPVAVCKCCPSNFMMSPLGGIKALSPQSFYQPGFPANMFSCGDQKKDPKKEEPEEIKCDINLDTVFQIADQVMQTAPSSYQVTVVSPEKMGPKTCSGNTLTCDSPARTIQSSLLCPDPIIVDVTGSMDLDSYRQQDESVLSVPEQMPEDAIFVE